jgi:hypothetical protein
VTAISYDSVELLKTFSDRVDLGFPLLSDPESRIIGEFDIINSEVPKDSPHYGFSYPGYYLVDAEGVVTAKFFNKENNDRTTAANILVREFNAGGGDLKGKAETSHLTLTWSASNATLRPGQRALLILEVEPKPGMHLYANGDHSYEAINWRVAETPGADLKEVSYPAAEIMHLPAIKETVPVYHEPLRIVRDLRVEGTREFAEVLQGQESLTLEGEFTYQACDAKKCYRPASVPLKWTFNLEEHDLVRVPDEVKRVPEED